MSNLDMFVNVAIALALILVAAQIVGSLARLIAQPRVVGEMIAGVLLGPTLFGKLAPELSASIFMPEIMPALFIICNLGLSLYMFLVGTEINLSLFNRKVLKDAGALSFGAIVVPFACGFLIASLFGKLLNTQEINYVSFGIFMGTALAITAFPMLARILQEQGIIDTRIGALSMLSASLQDVVSWILLGVVTAIATGGSLSGAWVMFVGALALVLVLFFIVQPLLRRWVEAKTEGEQLDPALFSTVLFLLIVCAVYTDHIGLYSVFGGFMLGLAMPRNQKFLQQLSVRLKDITLVLLLPVFFAFSGLNTDLTQLATSSLVLPSLIIIAIAFASKIVPLFATMRLSGYSAADAASIAALMNSRGLMELIIANIGLFYGLIDLPLFSILVLVAITTTLAAMPLYELAQKLVANPKPRIGVLMKKR
jgi:Kef-type K+ transport system membrane component KefB